MLKRRTVLLAGDRVGARAVAGVAAAAGTVGTTFLLGSRWLLGLLGKIKVLVLDILISRLNSRRLYHSCIK